jgi:hypothetical protein
MKSAPHEIHWTDYFIEDTKRQSEKISESLEDLKKTVQYYKNTAALIRALQTGEAGLKQRRRELERIWKALTLLTRQRKELKQQAQYYQDLLGRFTGDVRKELHLLENSSDADDLNLELTLPRIWTPWDIEE